MQWLFGKIAYFFMFWPGGCLLFPSFFFSVQLSTASLSFIHALDKGWKQV